jgi:hypothetical protein
MESAEERRRRDRLETGYASVAVRQKERERQARFRRYTSSLFLLATEILGYDRLSDRLSEEFHGPLLREWDRRDLLHSVGKYDRSELDMWPRGYYKTTCVIARVVRAFMLQPGLTVTWWHAVEEKAILSGGEIAGHFQRNRELRDLLPEGCKPKPFSHHKKWWSGSKFRMPCNGTAKDPSFFATGQSSEATGGHSDIVVLDDVIGEKTIEDSAMPRVRNWMGRTVSHILNPGGRRWVIGTRWDDDDIYADMLKNQDYDCTVRGCFETDGAPDPDGKPVLFSKRVLQARRREPGVTAYIFSCQMLNEPIPDEGRRWQQEMEQSCTLEEAEKGRGVTVVLSDPAPAGLSLRGEKDKERGEAGKDFWSVAVIRLRVHGDYYDTILLHGEHSQRWGEDEGWEVICRNMKRWRTDRMFNESYSGDAWTDGFLRVARRMGVKPKLERDGKGWRLPKYKSSYSANQKNLRFEALADLNTQGQFFICESCPKAFVHGDGQRTGFLTQMRKWLPLQKGRNNLKYDDDADVVARATDKAVVGLAPRRDWEAPSMQSPFRPLRQQDDYVWATRHIRFT